MKRVFQTIHSGLFFALSLIISLGVVSCQDEENMQFEFSISETQLSFLAEGGNTELNVLASEGWIVESNAEWCLVTPANGIGSEELELRVDTSYLYQGREAVLTFSSGAQIRQVTISQFGFNKVITPVEISYEMPDYNEFAKAYIEVTVNANIDFEVVIPEGAEWLTSKVSDAYVSSIPRPRTIRFDYTTNTRFVERVAEVTLRPKLDKDQSAESVTILLTQAAAETIMPSRRGDSLSLIAIGRVMNANAYFGWDVSKPFYTWAGVDAKELLVEGGNGETELRVTGLNILVFDTYESIPYQIQFLTELETLELVGNANSFMRKIALGPEITLCRKLKTLTLGGYGITSLPEEMVEMQSLERLDLYGNHFTELPFHILRELSSLKAISFSGNRFRDFSDLTDIDVTEYGLGGTIPRAIFEMEQLEEISLSYNFFENSIPNMPIGSMPNLKVLRLNLNYLTGEIPEWILQHPYLGCWDPQTLIFNQEYARDSQGRRAGFTNVPNRVPACPLNN